jgi:DNA-binding response OmpR family regulator
MLRQTRIGAGRTLTQPIPTDAATAVLRPDRPTATKVGARRALVLHACPRVVTLIELALQHGRFDIRAARNLAEAEAILATWPPDMAVVDMDHDDSTTLLDRLGTSNTLAQSETPVLGLTRRRDLRTKLQAFELGVDDILTLPVSPEELLARSKVITRQASWTRRPIIPRGSGDHPPEWDRS